MTATSEPRNPWFENHATLAAIVITLVGFLARLWAASGIFLNPDEALHFRLANQASLALAYKASLTAAHPPLFILLLYFWRALGASELWLRLPSALAGAVFCWMFYKWLSKTAGSLAGFIGLLCVALLPPIILIAAEVRQYALLLAFLISALYFLDEAFAQNSPTRMAAFSLCLYVAMLFHYSAFLFAAALGIYALIRIFTERPPAKLCGTWLIGQLGGLSLAAFLYKTHLSKLGAGDSRTAMQGWMSEYYLQRSYFDPARDHVGTFLAGHTFGVFQYFFGQLTVGIIMGVVFFVGIALLLREKNSPAESETHRISPRAWGIFLLIPFAITGCASLSHVYPYGGTRHDAFLIIPGVAGISVAIACLAECLKRRSRDQKRGWGNEAWPNGIAIAALVIAACIAFGKPRQPRMERADQSRTHMADALNFIRENIKPSDLIFTDYQSDLILGHYLCEQRPISLEITAADFEQFSCAGHQIVASDFRTAWMFWGDNFPREWRRAVQSYNLKPGDTVWIVQAGWGANLPADLQKHYAEFRNLHYESFGKNINIFRMTVGQPIPAPTP
jgi:4-amino-4-deoxy-L-arabinose transferase-like glycosyltransferase